MILMIDNYDSFTYNLVQYLYELNYEVDVKRNDEISIEQIRQLNPQAIILSPGPCTPNEAGVCLDTIKELGEDYAILGVCLGHQAICQAFGGKIVHAKELMHGKTSPIYHKNMGVFQNLPSPFTATRYHSLIAEKASLPDCLEITAWAEDETIMGIKHKTLAVEGVQFHPESIATYHGHDMLRNFLDQNI